MTKEIRETYNVDIEDLKDILAYIIEDEEKHEGLLSKIGKILMGKENNTDETTSVTFKSPETQAIDMLDK